jgi:hypothetical protein
LAQRNSGSEKRIADLRVYANSLTDFKQQVWNAYRQELKGKIEAREVTLNNGTTKIDFFVVPPVVSEFTMTSTTYGTWITFPQSKESKKGALTLIDVTEAWLVKQMTESAEIQVKVYCYRKDAKASEAKIVEAKSTVLDPNRAGTSLETRISALATELEEGHPLWKSQALAWRMWSAWILKQNSEQHEIFFRNIEKC